MAAPFLSFIRPVSLKAKVLIWMIAKLRLKLQICAEGLVFGSQSDYLLTQIAQHGPKEVDIIHSGENGCVYIFLSLSSRRFSNSLCVKIFCLCFHRNSPAPFCLPVVQGRSPGRKYAPSPVDLAST
ncbi:MAG: hypothetical protein P4L43_17725 [Syntrophobacteraceae bacterium]|nr:hypothetical protein [Syntrophobacteraceae bacterium]